MPVIDDIKKASEGLAMMVDGAIEANVLTKKFAGEISKLAIQIYGMGTHNKIKQKDILTAMRPAIVELACANRMFSVKLYKRVGFIIEAAVYAGVVTENNFDEHFYRKQATEMRAHNEMVARVVGGK